MPDPSEAKKGPYKKEEIISPEDIIPKVRYAITINPSDKRQFFECTDRIDKLKDSMIQLLLQVPNVDIDIRMEVSRAGRLHFHGTISWSNHEAIKHFFVIQIHQWMQIHNISIVKIGKDDSTNEDLIDHNNKWDEYCSKSRHLIDVRITSKDIFRTYRKIKVDKNGIAHKSYFAEENMVTIN